MKTVSLPLSVVRHAARLLEQEAQVAYEACYGAGVRRAWVCAGCQGGDCPAHKLHDELLAVAKKLKEAA